MNAKGDSSVLSLVVWAMLLLILAALIVVKFFPGLIGLGESITECPGVCTYTAELSQAYHYKVGDDWCQKGVYNVDGITYYDGRLPEGAEKKEVSGKQLELKCYNLRGGIKPEEVPSHFLGVSKRVDEIDEDETEQERITRIVNPPKIRAYFQDRSIPLRNGEFIEVVSGTQYTFTYHIDNVQESTSNTFLLVDKNGNPIDKDGKNVPAGSGDALKLYCKPQILDEEGKDISSAVTFTDMNSSNFCDDTKQGTFSIKVDAGYEDKVLDLIAVLTQDSSTKYNPSADFDTRFAIKLRVVNPVNIGGFTSAYTQEKTISVSCAGGVDCKQFFYQLVGPTEVCPTKTYVGVALNPAGAIEANYPSAGRGQIILDNQDFNNKKLCVYAVDQTGRVYQKPGPFPIKIDRTRPIVKGDFKPFKLFTEITCEDSAAGCTGVFGYHYVSHAVDFVGALFSGAKDVKYCPTDRGQYIIVRGQDPNEVAGTSFDPFSGLGAGSNVANQGSGGATVPTSELVGVVPLLSRQDFMVLCVMAEDNAGNMGRDILLVYNSYSVLEMIANDQLNNGGPGSGYYGYNLG